MKKTIKHDEDIDSLVAAIEDPTIEIKAKTTCYYKGCKEKLTIMSMECSICLLKYCSQHRLPEVHSIDCSDKIKKKTRIESKKDSLLLQSMKDKNLKIPGGNVKGILEKERKELKKKLHQKIQSARK
ncbi:hypothetical protein BC833DRAFT_583306 [Globomyces pollinis-pini]|nr:hypothetical protein BC833DRAFT_583306 [Globomyces pollinis-pini]KAJ3000787.1 hypothetical protein HDV02_003589 [Globomyces sp. JEL0801]